MPEPRRRHVLPTKQELDFFDWPLEKLAYCVVWLLLPLCLFWWLIDKWEPDDEDWTQKRVPNLIRAIFVLGWFAVLLAVWLLSPTTQPWQLLAGIVAGLRLLEIFVTGLGTILGQQQQIRARNVVTILVYAAQVVLIFAILYHSFAQTGFTHIGGGHNPSRPSDFLYISWTAFVSLGNGLFVPKTSAARFLEVATTSTSIFLVAVLLGYAIGAVQEPTPSPSPDPEDPSAAGGAPVKRPPE